MVYDILDVYSTKSMFQFVFALKDNTNWRIFWNDKLFENLLEKYSDYIFYKLWKRMRWICRTKRQMMKCIKMSKKRIFVHAIKTKRWIMIEHALKYVDKPHNVIRDGMVRF